MTTMNVLRFHNLRRKIVNYKKQATNKQNFSLLANDFTKQINDLTKASKTYTYKYKVHLTRMFQFLNLKKYFLSFTLL